MRQRPDRIAGHADAPRQEAVFQNARGKPRLFGRDSRRHVVERVEVKQGGPRAAWVAMRCGRRLGQRPSLDGAVSSLVGDRRLGRPWPARSATRTLRLDLDAGQFQSPGICAPRYAGLWLASRTLTKAVVVSGAEIYPAGDDLDA